MNTKQKSFAELVAQVKQLQKMENGTMKGGYVVLPPSSDSQQLTVNIFNCKGVCVRNKCTVVIGSESK